MTHILLKSFRHSKKSHTHQHRNPTIQQIPTAQLAHQSDDKAFDGKDTMQTSKKELVVVLGIFFMVKIGKHRIQVKQDEVK